MVKLAAFLRRHALTAGMIVFLAVFYSAFSLMHPKTDRGAPQEAAVSARMTPEEIKAREDRFRKNVEANAAVSSSISAGFLGAMVAGAGVGLWLLRRRLRRLPFLARTQEHHEVPWGMPAILNIFLLLLFVEALLLSAEFAYFWFSGREPLPRDLFVMLNSIVRDILVVGLLLWLVRRRFGRPLSEIGLTTRDFPRQAAAGLVTYLAALPVLVLVLALTQLVAQLVSYKFPPQPVVEMYLREEKHGTLAFFTIFVAVLGPVMEEIFFRGFAYKAFRTRFGVRYAALVTAVIFAALHASVIAFVPIFLLGLYLTYLYEKTGSLVPGMTAHILHNLLMVGLTLGFKSLSG
ncbi:MAG TPA: CPBP family intramembrane glutamic endopeptidase [Candidatus Eisenbacteria bacterium]|jgi:membrane protease YdiL (CAAX protease family)|nr:CPBP family intramembrane glutamic endopeptidase [Candidatus Eisenbacteria bacterium]